MVFLDFVFNINFLIFYRLYMSRDFELSFDVVCIQFCYRFLDNQEILKGFIEVFVEFYNG